MIPLPNARIVRFLPLLAALALAACATRPPQPAAPAVTPAAQEAERLLAGGDPLAAAEAYMKAAAEAATTAERNDRLLAAAEAYLKAGDADNAATALAGLDSDSLRGMAAYRARLVRAAIALAGKAPEQALESLRGLPADLPLDLMVRYHELRARAYLAVGNYLESARERVWLEGLLEDPEARAENHRQIYRALNRLSDAALVHLRTGPPDVLSGWMAFVQISRNWRDDPDTLARMLEDWRLRYPNHPADPALLENIAPAGEKLPVARPGRIAVLLPLSGPLQAPAEIIRDGLLAAYYAAADGEVTLRFYDTAADPLRVRGLYRQAVDEGAEFVIGPLDKDVIAALGRGGDLEVPVLALNRIPPESVLPEGLYQFALAPEDEAEQAAERAFLDGHRRALALVPDSAWGQRVFGAFLGRWNELGGNMLEVQRYGTQPKALSGVVRRLLNIDASERRRQQLTRLFGRRLEFEPRRRQDAEFVFLLAQPAQARLLRPLLRFHRAGDLPVYATSHPYAGTADPRRDRDMDDLMFCGMPWLLDRAQARPELAENLATLWPERMKRRPRLFALGIDAYEIVPALSALASGELARFEGVTGRLTLDNRGRLHRELLWARFLGGQPRLLPPPTPDIFPEDNDEVMEDQDEDSPQPAENGGTG